MAIFSPPYNLNPWPNGHELNKIGRRIQGDHNHAFIFFLTCVGVEKNSYETLAFLIITYIYVDMLRTTFFDTLVL